MNFELERILQKFFASNPERRFLVAVSGGMDSMALLNSLLYLIYPLAFEIVVATFDHQIREEGASDAAFVKDYCQQKGVTCVLGTANVPEIASQRKKNLEATAREVRYDFLVKTAREHGIGIVMTAHHADDQAETILMHLIRGAGLDGLSGMRQFSQLTDDVMLYRPILSLPRNKIEGEIRWFKVPFVEDATNADTSYTRNHLRQTLMPQLRRYSDKFNERITHMSQTLQEDADYLNRLAEEVIVQGRWEDEKWSVPFAVWQPLSFSIMSRVLRVIHRQMTTMQLELKHVREAYRLLVLGDVRDLTTLPGKIHAFVEYSDTLRVVIAKRPRTKPLPPPDEEVTIALGQTVTWRGRTLQLTQSDTSAFVLPKDATLTIRGRRDGDVIRPVGLKGKHKSLSKWFIGEKFGREQRDFVPLLCVNGEIALIGMPSGWVGCFGYTRATVSPESLSTYQGVQIDFLT